jgi:hypothetical protein
MFFPNELSKLLQAIFSIEDLKKLDLNEKFLKTRNGKMILASEYLRKLKNVVNKLYPNENMKTHSFRKYFQTQISRVNLTQIRNDIGSDVEHNFKEHLLGHKVYYSSKVYNQIINDINQFYELWKPLEASLCIDCEIVNTTNQDILDLKEKNLKLENHIKTLLQNKIESDKKIEEIASKTEHVLGLYNTVKELLSLPKNKRFFEFITEIDNDKLDLLIESISNPKRTPKQPISKEDKEIKGLGFNLKSK